MSLLSLMINIMHKYNVLLNMNVSGAFLFTTRPWFQLIS